MVKFIKYHINMIGDCLAIAIGLGILFAVLKGAAEK